MCITRSLQSFVSTTLFIWCTQNKRDCKGGGVVVVTRLMIVPRWVPHCSVLLLAILRSSPNLQIFIALAVPFNSFTQCRSNETLECGLNFSWAKFLRNSFVVMFKGYYFCNTLIAILDAWLMWIPVGISHSNEVLSCPHFFCTFCHHIQTHISLNFYSFSFFYF